VNTHGKVFERILHANSVPTHRVVIEIKESEIEQDKQLSEAIDNYRDRAYRIAIEGFGGKKSHIDRLWKLSPDFVKLDLSIIQQAESNHRVQKILPSLISLIKESGAQAIITGIETQTQLDIAIESGGLFVQGYFLARPVTAKALQPSLAFNKLTSPNKAT
jgi:EAL domain-containing protein (putative c-di-GMP-specific phosphodiesterase class I)